MKEKKIVLQQEQHQEERVTVIGCYTNLERCGDRSKTGRATRVRSFIQWQYSYHCSSTDAFPVLYLKIC
ncbi:CNT_collapsed_G0015990.mRNA.1.CDS.1 [Saccharomyces cerevisiae]|nr:CNT_collapsed_G0015990.mRNA.1.CDS.1 [Saccharomyces cerevisiae]